MIRAIEVDNVIGISERIDWASSIKGGATLRSTTRPRSRRGSTSDALRKLADMIGDGLTLPIKRPKLCQSGWRATLSRICVINFAVAGDTHGFDRNTASDGISSIDGIKLPEQMTITVGGHRRRM